jgi:hypothetical protein
LSNTGTELCKSVQTSVAEPHQNILNFVFIFGFAPTEAKESEPELHIFFVLVPELHQNDATLQHWFTLLLKHGIRLIRL